MAGRADEIASAAVARGGLGFVRRRRSPDSRATPHAAASCSIPQGRKAARAGDLPGAWGVASTRGLDPPCGGISLNSPGPEGSKGRRSLTGAWGASISARLDQRAGGLASGRVVPGPGDRLRGRSGRSPPGDAARLAPAGRPRRAAGRRGARRLRPRDPRRERRGLHLPRQHRLRAGDVRGRDPRPGPRPAPAPGAGDRPGPGGGRRRRRVPPRLRRRPARRDLATRRSTPS